MWWGGVFFLFHKKNESSSGHALLDLGLSTWSQGRSPSFQVIGSCFFVRGDLLPVQEEEVFLLCMKKKFLLVQEEGLLLVREEEVFLLVQKKYFFLCRGELSFSATRRSSHCVREGCSCLARRVSLVMGSMPSLPEASLPGVRGFPPGSG